MEKYATGNLVLKISHILKAFAKNRREYTSFLNTLAIASRVKIVILYKCVLVESAQVLIAIYVVEPITIIILNLFCIF